MNASALAVQVFVGGEHETKSIHNLTRLVDAGNRYGVPVLAVTAVGKEMVRDAKYFRLATRICAELGAHYVKTYYVEDGFETVTSCCPVPIVIAGGKKLPELGALTMVRNAVSAVPRGVDMGRNIFQSGSPVGDAPRRPRRRPGQRLARRSARPLPQARRGGPATLEDPAGWRGETAPGDSSPSAGAQLSRCKEARAARRALRW